jgi:hypothetical protein
LREQKAVHICGQPAVYQKKGSDLVKGIFVGSGILFDKNLSGNLMAGTFALHLVRWLFPGNFSLARQWCSGREAAQGIEAVSFCPVPECWAKDTSG